MGDFVSSLVQLRDQELARGDIVYERVAWGESEQQTKLNRLRVLRVDRAAAFCEYFDKRRKPRLIPFHELRMEPKASISQPPPPPQTQPRMRLIRPPAASEPAPAASAPTRSTRQSDFEAWLEMGRGLIDDADLEKPELEAQLIGVQDELAALDEHHRVRIASLEQELLDAKRMHQEARRYPVSRLMDALRKLMGA